MDTLRDELWQCWKLARDCELPEWTVRYGLTSSWQQIPVSILVNILCKDWFQNSPGLAIQSWDQVRICQDAGSIICLRSY